MSTFCTTNPMPLATKRIATSGAAMAWRRARIEQKRQRDKVKPCAECLSDFCEPTDLMKPKTFVKTHRRGVRCLNARGHHAFPGCPCPCAQGYQQCPTDAHVTGVAGDLDRMLDRVTVAVPTAPVGVACVARPGAIRGLGRKNRKALGLTVAQPREPIIKVNFGRVPDRGRFADSIVGDCQHGRRVVFRCIKGSHDCKTSGRALGADLVTG